MATKILTVFFVTVITIFNYSEAWFFIDPPMAPPFEWSEVKGLWTYVANKSSMPSRTINFIIDESDEEVGKVIITELLRNGTSTVTDGKIELNEAVIKFGRHYVAAEDLTYYTTYVPIKVMPKSYIVFASFICPEHPVKGSYGTSARLVLTHAFRNTQAILNYFDEVKKYEHEYAVGIPTGTLINCL